LSTLEKIRYSIVKRRPFAAARKSRRLRLVHRNVYNTLFTAQLD
jgi:hypothetical protein